MKKWRACELCGGDAAVYCGADSAYLCWACDARVHGANFLVARHLRAAACSSCTSAAAARLISGPGYPSSPSMPVLCKECSAETDKPSSCCSSSLDSAPSCISTAKSTARPRQKVFIDDGLRRRAARAAVEGVLAGWCKGLGLKNGRRCADVAAHVLKTCGRGMAGLPLRVALAAALWHAIKAACSSGKENNEEKVKRWSTCEIVLKKLESKSHVPSRLIVEAESRLARASCRRGRGAEEGWAEYSPS